MSENPLRQASDSQRFISQRRNTRKKRYFKAVLLLLLAVLAGMVIGVGGTMLYIRDKFHRRPPKPEAVARIMIKHVREAVAINDDEEQKIKITIDQHMNDVEAMRRETFKDFRVIIDRMDADIAEILGAERATTWETWKEKNLGKRRKDDEEGKDKRHSR